MMGRVMGVDPGGARTGVAVSDPTRTIARPLTVIQEQARQIVAAEILRCAEEEGVAVIVVGVALNLEGEVGPQARQALRLVEVLRAKSDLMIITRDESFSTQDAGRTGGAKAPEDARAAALILQEYLDAQHRA